MIQILSCRETLEQSFMKNIQANLGMEKWRDKALMFGSMAKLTKENGKII